MSYKEVRHSILSGDKTHLYPDIFDSMDSDTVVELLREFHATQSNQSIKQLITQLNIMLNVLIIKELL